MGNEFGSISGQVGEVEVTGGCISGVTGYEGLTKRDANQPSLHKAQLVLPDLPLLS